MSLFFHHTEELTIFCHHFYKTRNDVKHSTTYCFLSL